MMSATLIVLLILFIHIWVKIIRLSKETMYSYKLMSMLSLTIFIGITIGLQLRMMILLASVAIDPTVTFYFFSVFDVSDDFAFFVFPATIAIGALMLISNLILLKINGKSFTNVAGTAIAAGLIVLTLFADSIFLLYIDLGDIEANEIYTVVVSFRNLILVVVSYLECMLVGSLVCTIRAARHKPKYDQDYLIILGCYAGDGKNLPSVLKRRVDAALDFATMQSKTNGKDLIFIASGGKGNDERISEAKAIADYIIRKGIPKKRILIEDKSINTLQNFKFSKKLITDKSAKVAFATTGYHVFRSGVLAHKVGLNAVGISSKTKWYFYANAVMREFAANLVSEKKTHIFNLAIITIALISLAIFCYFNGVF